MARMAVKNRELKRIKQVERYSEKRKALKAELQQLMKDPDENFEAIMEAQAKLQKLPHNSCPVQVRRRCRITGRSRGVYRKVGFSKGMFRLLAMRGMIPGVVKASW